MRQTVRHGVILRTVGTNEWVEAQIAAAKSLVGQSIIGWDAIEMAIHENRGGTDAEFGDPAAPCRQLSMLAVLFEIGEPVVVAHYQGDEAFGFRLDRAPLPFSDWHRTEGIYRRRRPDELPTGLIRSATIRTSRATRDFAELLLDISGVEVLLIAGEIEETPIGRLAWRWLDESTLVFPDPSAVGALDWIPLRDYDEQRA